jgi:hypothetical protein
MTPRCTPLWYQHWLVVDLTTIEQQGIFRRDKYARIKALLFPHPNQNAYKLWLNICWVLYLLCSFMLKNIKGFFLLNPNREESWGYSRRSSPYPFLVLRPLCMSSVDQSFLPNLNREETRWYFSLWTPPYFFKYLDITTTMYLILKPPAREPLRWWRFH